MLMKSLPEALRTADSAISKIRSLAVVSDSRTALLSKRDARASGGASDAETDKTNDGEKFWRVSAFENDHRVTADNGLVPDPYATTEDDGNKVKTGSEAVERYALPNNAPASYRFTIKPLRDTKIKKGIVQPPNGHQGGG